MEPKVPPPAFSLFPELPFEIRLKIWELALPEPRVIQVRDTDKNPLLGSDPVLKAIPCHCASLCDVYPSIAAVTSESRAVFMEHFTFCFGTHVSWKYDTMYLHWDLSSDTDRADYTRQVLKNFIHEILKTPGGDQMSSLAMDIHWFWLPVALSEGYYQPGTPETHCFFDHFPRMKQFLAVHGHIGLFERIPVRQLSPGQWPDYEDAPAPDRSIFRPGSYEICMRLDEGNYRPRIWPPGSGIQFVEANATDETVWIGDPTFVAEDFVRELYEEGEWGNGGRKPVIKIVAIRVHTGCCFTEEPRSTDNWVEGRKQLEEDIIFQKNWMSTC